MPSIPGSPSTAPAQPGRRRALVICNGTFAASIPRLAGPAMDAALLQATLSDPETCGFNVRTLLDRGLLEVRREIARICAEAEQPDTLLIYYSGTTQVGHDGSLYLLLADSDDEYLSATGLDTDFILSQLRESRCRQFVVLVDACFAGRFFQHNRGIPDGLYAITSCGAFETCADTPEGGAFTMALCAGLRGAAADSDGDGRVTIDDLHDFVKQRLVEQQQHGGGTPQKWIWNVPAPIYMATVPRPVFISYAREDTVAADRLVQALEAEGLATWVDREGIRSGNWKERVTSALNQSRAVVMLLTTHSLASNAVQKELAFAAKKRVPIIPVQFGELDAGALPDWFMLDYEELHRHALDEERFAESVRRLADSIRRLRRQLGGKAVQSPPSSVTGPSGGIARDLA